MNEPPSKTSFFLSLQARILALVLFPLLLTTAILVIVDAFGRIEDNRANLVHQRELLIETRQVGVRDVVESARTAIQPASSAAVIAAKCTRRHRHPGTVREQRGRNRVRHELGLGSVKSCV